MGTPGFSIQVGADQLCAFRIAGGEKHPIVRRTEMRRFAVARNAGCCTSAGRNPVDAGFGGSARVHQISAITFLEYDGLAIRREARAGIMAGSLGNGLAGATICRNGMD